MLFIKEPNLLAKDTLKKRKLLSLSPSQKDLRIMFSRNLCLKSMSEICFTMSKRLKFSGPGKIYTSKSNAEMTNGPNLVPMLRKFFTTNKIWTKYHMWNN